MWLSWQANASYFIAFAVTSTCAYWQTQRRGDKNSPTFSLYCLSVYVCNFTGFLLLPMGVTEEEVFNRRQSILPAISLLHEVCGNIAALCKWYYNLEQQNNLLSRFQALSRWGRRLHKNSHRHAGAFPCMDGGSCNWKTTTISEGRGANGGTAEGGADGGGDTFLRPCCSLCSLTNFDCYHWLGRWVAHLTAAFRGCWNDERNKFLVRITTARGLAALTKMVGLHRTHAQPMS